MSRYLFLEGASGISGDMTVAALLSLGASQEKLFAVLRSLELPRVSFSVSQKNISGMQAWDFLVEMEEERDHDHQHHHHHEHRNYTDVCAVLDRGDMTPSARALAKKIFRIVAEAESKAHDKPLEEVHFHEVGAVDSIADIAGAAVLYDDLALDGCIVTGLTEGSGFVHCQHGDLPVPVPAVLNIAEAYSVALRPSGETGEMVTPTGIAIAAALRTHSTLPAEYVIEKNGLGAGKKTFSRPNILRAMILRDTADPEQVYVVECNIDDAPGEIFGYAMDRLFAAGAKDVCFIPCFMKKNRPAYIIKVLVSAEHLAAVEETLFLHTSTIGLRKYPVDRVCMERHTEDLALPCGTVQIKRCTIEGISKGYPEYESVRHLAEETGLDFRTVYDMALRKAQE